MRDAARGPFLLPLILISSVLEISRDLKQSAPHPQHGRDPYQNVPSYPSILLTQLIENSENSLQLSAVHVSAILLHTDIST
jgi:hypothetical protein